MAQLMIGQHIIEVTNHINSARKIIENSTEDFDRLHYFLIHCAIISKIINPNTKPKLDENGNERPVDKFRRLRAQERRDKMVEYFGDNYKNFIKENYANSFRNHLEHIDEGIDEAALSGCILDKNIVRGPSPVFVGFNQKSSLRGYMNGVFNFNGKNLDTNKIRSWLDSLDVFIKNKGTPNTGAKLVMINNRFS